MVTLQSELLQQKLSIQPPPRMHPVWTEKQIEEFFKNPEIFLLLKEGNHK